MKIQLFRDLREGRALRTMRESGFHTVFLDYPIRSVLRYGHGKPPHGLLLETLTRNRSTYEQILLQFLQFAGDLRTIPINKPDDPRMPYWLNGFFQGLDPVSLYAFTCLQDPQTYVEIGSGNSTKFVRKAIQDHKLRTRVVSIDPNPRTEIDALCDEIHRESLEEMDLTVFDTLGPRDIVLLDGSHRVFMNSDVSVFFLEILPRLRAGSLVCIDDIYLPFDYPPEWASRYYSEQYLLAVLLLADTSRYEILLPCTFIESDPALQRALDALWRQGPLAEARGPGNGFWLRIRGSEVSPP